MNDPNYSKRELDEKFKDIMEKLTLILVQTTKHNGRLSRLEKITVILASVVATILILKGSQFIQLIKLMI